MVPIYRQKIVWIEIMRLNLNDLSNYHYNKKASNENYMANLYMPTPWKKKHWFKAENEED